MNMKQALRTFLAGILLLTIATATYAGDAVEIRLQDGTRWTGELRDKVELTYRQRGVEIHAVGTLTRVTDYFITIDTNVAGEVHGKTIFKADIVKLASIGHSKDGGGSGAVMDMKHAGGAGPAAGKGDAKAAHKGPGVFVLPLKGQVGLEFRHDEIEKVAEEADKYGRGQIIVLIIDSGGGSVVELEKIHDTLTEIKKRHRLVAWIKQAISAACATAMHCDEIYFMTNGTAGAMTAFNGATGQAWTGEELEKWEKNAGDWMEAAGRSRYIAEAMIHNPNQLSYDKDPVTGKVTFYNDLSGEHILSRSGENLVFTASTALDCGFSDGTADNEQELAKLLDLDEWYETSDYGRRIAADWEKTVETAKEELPLLQQRLQYAGTGSGDQVEILGNRIKIYEKFVRWKDRCPPCTAGLPSKEDLERDIAAMRKDLADMKRRRR